MKISLDTICTEKHQFWTHIEDMIYSRKPRYTYPSTYTSINTCTLPPLSSPHGGKTQKIRRAKTQKRKLAKTRIKNELERRIQGDLRCLKEDELKCRREDEIKRRKEN